MAHYSICNLNSLIVSLANIVSQYDETLSETIQNYDSMEAQVMESLDESREYWNNFANDERLSSGEQAGTVIESIESLLTRMRAILAELARLDKSFDKYYSKHKEDSSLLTDDLNETTDYLAIVRRLSDKLRLEANECSKTIKTSVYKGYKQDKIEMRGDRAEMSDFPLYLNTVAGGLDRRDQTIGGFSFVVKIYALPVVEIIG